MNRLTLALASVLLFVACAGPGAARTGSAPKAAPKPLGPFVANGDADVSTGRVQVAMTDTMKFSPNNLKARAGQTFTIEGQNAGSVVHTVIAPELGLATAARANGGQTLTATLTAPSAPGTYDWWCNEPGHSEAGMNGKLTVQ